MRTNKIIIIKQDKIPTIADNECHLALKEDKFLLEINPHGYRDIQYLLYKSGKAKQWVQEGKKYMVLFMDTNVLAFNCIPVSIGSRVKYGFDVNSVTVPRRVKDVIGIFCKLINKDGKSCVQNVEYNFVDSLFKDRYNGKGDVPNDKGLCDFPGNLNVIAFKLKIYLNIIEEKKGLAPEFVNPKYTDETRTKFKHSTGLEGLMQDIPKLIKHGEKVGYTKINSLKRNPPRNGSKFPIL